MVFGGKWWPGRYTFGNVNRDTLSGGSFQFCERKRKEKWKKDFLFKGTLKGQGSQIVSISCTKQVQCFFRHAHELRWKCWNGDEMILILVAQDYEIICIIYMYITHMIHKNIINDFFCYFGHVGRWKNPLLSLFLLREATPPQKKKRKEKSRTWANSLFLLNQSFVFLSDMRGRSIFRLRPFGAIAVREPFHQKGNIWNINR